MEQVKSEHFKFGQGKSGQCKSGQFKSGQGKLGQVKSRQVKLGDYLTFEYFESSWNLKNLELECGPAQPDLFLV